MSNQRPDLRERQRQQNRALIRAAAFELFEERGVASVTVDDIAQTAGVSPRTFFRYFPVKEYAASPGIEMLLEAVESFEPSGSTPAEVFEAVMGLLEDVVKNPDSHGPGGPLRFRRLMLVNPELRTAAAGREQEIMERLSERLVETLPDIPPPVLRLISETSLALWRTAWAVWTEAAIKDPETDMTPRTALEWSRKALPSLQH